MIKPLGILNAVCLLIVILCFSVEIPTFSKSFYSSEYDKYRIPAQIQVPKDDLMLVTGKLLAYMKGQSPDLVIEANIAGEYHEFFNSREKDHMVDVRNLILGGMTIRNYALAVIVASIIITYIFRIKFIRILIKSIKHVFVGFLIIITLLITFVVLNFEKAFTIFHELFFNNDLWILNPDTDLLVNIVPLGFFMDISAVLSVIFVILCLATITISILAERLLFRRLDTFVNKGTLNC